MVAMTDKNPTPEQMAEWQRKTDAATEEPWEALLGSKGLTGVHGPGVKIYHTRLDPECLLETHERQKADAAFGAMARGAMPILLNRVRWLEENDEHLRDAARILEDEVKRLRASIGGIRLDCTVPGCDDESPVCPSHTLIAKMSRV